MERDGVFKRFANGSAAVVGRADDFNDAKAKMQDGALKTGKEYCVYDFVLGQFVVTSRESSKAVGSSPK